MTRGQRARATWLGLAGSIVLAAGCTATVPSASPSPSPLTPDKIVAAFITTVADPDRSYRMDVDGETQGYPFTGSYTVEGANVMGMAAVEGIFDVEFILVDGLAYQRSNGGEWDQGTSTMQLVPDPFREMTGAEVEYVAAEEDLHRLSARDPLDVYGRAFQTSVFEQAAASDASFDVYVDSRGRPQRAELAIEGTWSGGDLTITYSFIFEDWGGDFSIALPPELVPTPSPTAFVPPTGSIPDSAVTGRLALSADWGGGNYAIVVIDPDGGNGKAWLEPHGAIEMNYGLAYPAWSPDGRRLAYAQTRCPYPGEVCVRVIAVVDENGTVVDITPADPDVLDGDPTWSPDGQTIIFDSNRGVPVDAFNGSNLFAINADGSGMRQIATGLVESRDPDVSPDGSLILFEGSDGQGREGIFTARPDGSELTLISEGRDGGGSHPVWSPDGSDIAWSRWAWDNRQRLVVMNADGSNPIEMIEGTFRDWSPNGQLLLFVYPPMGQGGEVWVVRADGAGARMLPFDDGLAQEGLDWAPYPSP